MASRKFVVALCAVFVTTVCYAKGPAMTDVKTYCFGRYQVGVPSDAQINGQAYEYMFGQIKTDSDSTSKSAYQQQVAQREADLRAGKEKNQYSLVGTRQPTSNSEIFEISRKLLMGPSIGVEVYKWDKDHVFSMREKGFDPEKYQSVLSDLGSRLLPNLQARNTDEVPTRSGFCIKDGFVADDGSNPQYEDAGISFKFARWPGVLVSVRTMTVTKLGEPKLLERIDSTPVPDVLKDVVGLVKTLRKGRRTVNGREGEEILETYPTDQGFRTHQFRWEAQGTQIGEALKPTLIVEFESGMFKDDHGNPLRPNMTDDQAVAIFDAVVNSIRLRPASGGVVSSAEPSPTLPLGTLSQTGSICPQTGWWTCPEASGHEIMGGRRQWFIAGSMMPVTTVLGSRNFTDKLLGKQPQYNVNTTWQLVGLESLNAAEVEPTRLRDTDPS